MKSKSILTAAVLALLAIGWLVLRPGMSMDDQAATERPSTTTATELADKNQNMTTSASAEENHMAVATFGAGCFWGVEAAFRQIEGVTATSVGYSGGTTKNPSYQDVCSDGTGHAEVVRVEYDPTRVSYEKLLDVFWNEHDPTTVDRQGPDVGSQYRSVIFYANDEQKAAAIASKQRLEQSEKYKRPIVTQIVPEAPFYRAEDYHQQYLEKRGLSTCRIK